MKAAARLTKLLASPHLSAADCEPLRQHLHAIDKIRHAVAGDNPVVVVEPWTASWVASSIAAGMLGWVGAKLIEDMFGQDDEDMKVSDAVAIIVQAMDQLQRFIGRALSQQTLSENVSRLNALFIRIEHYNTAPSDDRLFAATSSAEEVESGLSSLGLVGHHSYLVAIGVHCLVLQDRVKRFGVRDKENIFRTLRRGIAHAEKMQKSWEPWVRGLYRYSGIIAGTIAIHILSRDGIEVKRAMTSLENVGHHPIELQEVIEREVADVIRLHVVPSESVVSQWEAFLTAECT